MILSDYWYKNAIVYALDVETYQDGNGDGIGDFRGLIHRLDYLSGLGVTCLWLLPFYPSPLRDNGYDVSDYYGVDPRLGTLGNFVEFIREAEEYGIRIIIDLVVNHTSNEHPWFQAARSDRNSPYRDWYVWTDTPHEHDVGEPMFPGEQDRTWTLDERTGQYYLHHFYSFQPDLNVNNPDVVAEIKRIMGFWIQLGVSGFRVDAAPHLIEDTSERGKRGGGEEPRYELLHELREFLDRRRGDAVLLAEANVTRSHLPKYYANGDRFQMLFNFLLNQDLFVALAQQSGKRLEQALADLPKMPDVCQWANFIRNHDELSLDQLSEEDRQIVFDTFAPEQNMRIYGRGVRRRLPPMLNGDWRRVAMTYSLLFTLPGTPVLRYGEEIGMGEDLSLPGRNSVRTVMQWEPVANGGFSSATPERLARPAVADGPFSYHQINVSDQERDRNSTLNRIHQMIRVRRHCPEFGWGTYGTGLTCNENPSVLTHKVSWRGGSLLALHNLGSAECSVSLEPSKLESEHLTELLSDESYPTLVRRASDPIPLNPYGYRWYRVGDSPA